MHKSLLMANAGSPGHVIMVGARDSDGYGYTGYEYYSYGSVNRRPYWVIDGAEYSLNAFSYGDLSEAISFEIYRGKKVAASFYIDVSVDNGKLEYSFSFMNSTDGTLGILYSNYRHAGQAAYKVNYLLGRHTLTFDPPPTGYY